MFSILACEMPPDSGYTDGSHKDSYYYYDVNTKQCSTFYFYGYGGNDNRFRSKENCEKTCIGYTHSSDGAKIVKNKIVWCKIVIFHTKYPKYFRASLRSAQFFKVRPPNLKS
jgi:hypothetical protein